MEKGLATIQLPRFESEVPASLKGKVEIALANVREQMASLALVLGEGWSGEAPDEIQKIHAELEKCGHVDSRLGNAIDSADVMVDNDES